MVHLAGVLGFFHHFAFLFIAGVGLLRWLRSACRRPHFLVLLPQPRLAGLRVSWIVLLWWCLKIVFRRWFGRQRYTVAELRNLVEFLVAFLRDLRSRPG